MKNKIWLILILGLGLRLTGIHFGLPHLYHADEPIVVNHALAYGTGDLNPHFFKIPPLVSYLLFACYGIFFLLGRTVGWFENVQDFEALFYGNPTSFYLIARILFGVLLGTATLGFFYRSIKRHFNETLAWAATFLFAVCFLHVRDSHYIYTDIPLIFAMTLAFDGIWRVWESPKKWQPYLFFGLWAGISIAAKYNGIVLLVPFAAALFTNRKKGDYPKAAAASVLALTVFFILNPFSVLDFQTFKAEVLKQDASLTGAGWIHHFKYSLAGAGGTLLLISASLGLLLVLSQRKDRKKAIFAIFGLAYYALIALKGQHYDRYVLPLVPVLVFFAADFCLTLSERVSENRKALTFAILLFAVSIPSLYRCFLWNQVILNGDTRDLARDWIETQIAEGSKIALDWEFYAPRLRFTEAQLAAKKAEIGTDPHFSQAQLRRLDYYLLHSPKPSYELYFLQQNAGHAERPFLFSSPVVPYDFNVLKKQNIQYVVFIDLPLSGPRAEFHRRLNEEATLLERISAYKAQGKATDLQPLTGTPFLLSELLERRFNGHTLEIYQLAQE